MIKDLAVDDTSIYFIRDALLSMPKGGGPVTPLPSDRWTFGNRIAIDRDAFYYRCAGLGCGVALLRQPRSSGPPAVVADAHPIPQDVIVDGTSLYWISEAEQFLGGTKVMKVAKTGGAPVELARFDDRSLTTGYVPSWTVAGGFVYLALDGISGQDRIVRVPVDGGAAETVVRDEVSGRLLVADQFLVYLGDDAIRRVSLAGDRPGEPETWAPVVAYSRGEAVAGGRLYWVDGDSLYTRAAPDARTIRVARILDDRPFPRQPPLSIHLGAVDDEHAYVHDTLARIMAAPLAVPGPDVTLIADVGEEPGSLIVVADGALATQRYRSGGSGRVLAIGETAWSVKVADPRALSLAGDDVYWLDNADVMRAPRHGGPAALVASSGTGTTLAVDADHVYWLVNRELLRVPRHATANDAPWAEENVDRVTRVPGQPYLLALSADSIYMFTCLAGAEGSYPNRYPLESCRRAALYRQAKSGGAPVELVRTTATPMALAAGEDGVFYTERDGMRGRVVKIDPAGKTVVIAADQVSPGPLTLTDAEVLWANRADWHTGPDPAPLEDLAIADPRLGIWRAPRSGGPAVLVASVRDLPGLNPVALACDPTATSIYWLDNDGALSRARLR
jgi:hypothetical protein